MFTKVTYDRENMYVYQVHMYKYTVHKYIRK